MNTALHIFACKIEGCGKSHEARGWCRNHYKRWLTHGDPLGGGTSKGEALRYFREVVLTFGGNECLEWPFGKGGNGYGRLWFGGKMHVVSRLACEKVGGKPPSPAHEAAHSCGKGHLACVNPRHLSWKTRTANMADKRLHGTQPHKLDVEHVRAIRGLGATIPVAKLAGQFGVSKRSIYAIKARQKWDWVA